MVRASLRPLTDIEETAGEIADGRPEPAGARTRPAHRDRQPRPVAEHHAEPDRGRVPRAGGIRGGGAPVRGADAPLHRRRQPRAAYPADRDPRLRRVLPPARRAGPALGPGRGARGRGPGRVRRRAAARRPGPDHAAGGEGSGPDGPAGRGPAAAGPAGPAAAAGPASRSTCSALAADAVHDTRLLAPSPDHRAVGAARRGVPGHRRRAAAAAGHREPDEQRAHPHPGRDARSRCRSARGRSTRGCPDPRPP